MPELGHTTAITKTWFDGTDNRDLAVRTVSGEGGQMSLAKPPPVAQGIQPSAPRTEKILCFFPCFSVWVINHRVWCISKLNNFDSCQFGTHTMGWAESHQAGEDSEAFLGFRFRGPTWHSNNLRHKGGPKYVFIREQAGQRKVTPSIWDPQRDKPLLAKIHEHIYIVFKALLNF